jgi:HSP20 family protein
MKELDQWFDINQRQPRQHLPAVNVKEDNEAYQIEVAVPGMKKEDFKVEIEHNILKISATKEDRNEDKEQQGKYTKKEFHFQSFERSFRLPEKEVNGDKAAASYEDGILSIHLPKVKKAEEKPGRLIEIA